MTSRSIEDAIFALLAEREPGRTISPSEAAQAVDPEDWRRVLPQVRATAIGLARQGRLVLTRKGRPADPDALKGVYRVRLP